MIYATLSIIGIIFLVVCWFVYRRNIECFLCMLLAMYSEFFYLIPQIHQDLNLGADDYKLVLLPILTILLCESILSRKLALGRYGLWVISFLGITLFGVIVAWFYGQGLDLGIKAAKFMPLVMVYFLIAGRHINTEKFTTYFIIMALAVSIIATIHYFKHGVINMFPGLPKKGFTNIFERDAIYRITVGEFIIPVAALAAFAKFRKNFNMLYLLAFIALFLEVIFVQQTRTLIAALLLSTLVVFALSKRLTAMRISVYIIFAGLIFASSLFLSTYDFNNISLVNRTKTDFERRKGSFQGRVNSYTYYWHEIQKRPVAGYGIINFNWEGSKERNLWHRGIYLSDIGIVPFIVQAGIIGFIWLIYGLSKLWVDIFRFRDQLLITSYFIIATITMPTIDMFLRRDSLFLFAIFLGILSSKIPTAKMDSVTVRA